MYCIASLTSKRNLFLGAFLSVLLIGCQHNNVPSTIIPIDISTELIIPYTYTPVSSPTSTLTPTATSMPVIELMGFNTEQVYDVSFVYAVCISSYLGKQSDLENIDLYGIVRIDQNRYNVSSRKDRIIIDKKTCFLISRGYAQRYALQQGNHDLYLILTARGRGVEVVNDKQIIEIGEYVPVSLEQLVQELDTPEKLAEFMSDYFKFTYHDGCISYSPVNFLSKGKGDCKDYATFASYVLDKNGYKSKLVSFHWSSGSVEGGHVVVIYQKSPGSEYYKYMSNEEIMGDVSSIDTLLKKEEIRLNAKIDKYIVYPAGTLNVCT